MPSALDVAVGVVAFGALLASFVLVILLLEHLGKKKITKT